MRRAVRIVSLLARPAAFACMMLLAFPISEAVAYTSYGATELFPPGTVIVSCVPCHAGRTQDAKGPHAGVTSTTSICKTCHFTAHDAYGPNLLFQSRTTVVCRACHDGTGAGGVYYLTNLGITPGGAHRIEGTSAVPGGDAATGGGVTRVFSGAGGRLGCEDCHSPHGNRTVTPFWDSAYRYNDPEVPHDVLLRARPTGAVTTATAYGSDWCMTCHAGRGSGGAVHTHPVDSERVRPDPFTHDNVLIGGPLVPSPIAVSPDDSSVYVADVGNRRVSQFTTAGVPVRRWTVSTNGHLSGLAFTGDRDGDGQRDLMTSDILTGLSVVPYGDGVRWWRQDGTAAFHEDFFCPQPVKVLGDNRAGTRPTGLYDANIGQLDTRTYQNRGANIASSDGAVVSSTGRLFVVDSVWHRVAVFDRIAGTLPFLFAFPAAGPATPGGGDGQFRAPMAIAVSPTDTVYVADTGNDRIQCFDVNGTFLRKWGASGNGPGQLRKPTGIAVGNDGTVYVADQNQRIQRFSGTGTFLGEFGSRGDGPGELSLPYAVEGPLDGKNNSVFLMADPRLSLQEGHGPICQQCHDDSRDAGDLIDGIPAPVPQAVWPAPPNVPYFAFPHETSGRRLLIEQDDDLCMNCHAAGTLP